MKAIVVIWLMISSVSVADMISEMKQACAQQDNNACFDLGLSYADGDGVRQDYVKAKKYYIQACNMNHSSACFMAGVLFAEGEGVKQDYAKAARYFHKSCELGSNAACDTYDRVQKKL